MRSWVKSAMVVLPMTDVYLAPELLESRRVFGKIVLRDFLEPQWSRAEPFSIPSGLAVNPDEPFSSLHCFIDVLRPVSKADSSAKVGIFRSVDVFHCFMDVLRPVSKADSSAKIDIVRSVDDFHCLFRRKS